MNNIKRVYEIVYLSEKEQKELVEKFQNSESPKILEQTGKELEIVNRKIKIGRKLINEDLVKRGLLRKEHENIMGADMTFYYINNSKISKLKGVENELKNSKLIQNNQTKTSYPTSKTRERNATN